MPETQGKDVKQEGCKENGKLPGHGFGKTGAAKKESAAQLRKKRLRKADAHKKVLSLKMVWASV